MNRSTRAALPYLTMNEAWGELKLNGQLLPGIRPRSRVWRLMKIIMVRAPEAVSVDELFAVCTTADTADPKGAVHDGIRRLREALARGAHGADALIQTCDGGGWRLLARPSVLTAAPATETTSQSGAHAPLTQ
jgi:DNA-binding winged helix-turn-helix (wHTH) protein